MNTQARDLMHKQKVMHKLLEEVKMLLDRAEIICDEGYQSNPICINECPFDNGHPRCLLGILLEDTKRHEKNG